MAEINVSSGRARLAVVVRTRQPYVLFQDKISEGFVVNLRYLSLNVGTDSSGTNEVSSFTNRNEIPILDVRYHRLIMLCAGKIIAGELAPLTNPDGSERYPGMTKALAWFTQEYEMQLAKDREEASNRSIGRQMQAFNFSGAEFPFAYY